MSIRVLICDDDSLIRESLKVLLPLKGDIEIVAEGEDGQQAIDLCMEGNVDVALLDIRMPNVSGVKEIVEKTNTKCLILTTFDEEDYINEAMEYGTKGYILKNSSPEQIVQSITSVFNNTIVMNENVLSKLQGKAVEPQFKKYDFTAREKDIITNKNIIDDAFFILSPIILYLSNMILILLFYFSYSLFYTG